MPSESSYPTAPAPSPSERFTPEYERKRTAIELELRETGRFPGWPNDDGSYSDPSESDWQIVHEVRAELAAEAEQAREAEAAQARDVFGAVTTVDAYAPVPERPWAIEGVLIDGAMTYVAGDVKAGKSTLCAELAVSLATGSPMFGMADFPTRVEPQHVFYIQTEDPDERVQRDVQQVMRARDLSDPSAFERIHFAPRPKGGRPRFNLMDANHYVRLRDYMDEVGARYVILNPLVNLIGDELRITDHDQGHLVTTRLTRLRDQGFVPIVVLKLRAGARADFRDIVNPTVFNGWVESGLLISHNQASSTFTLKARFERDRDTDNRRDYKLRGLGVGKWEWAEPRAKTNFDQYLALRQADPSLTRAELASKLEVSERTVSRYAKQAETEVTELPPAS